MAQATKYANVFVKIGAGRGVLLSREKLQALTESKNLPEFVQQLEETNYQNRITKISVPLTSRNLERIFNEALIDAYIRIIKSSPKQVTPYLYMHLKRFELENVKALVKSIYSDLSFEEKLNKIYPQAEDYLKNRALFDEASKISDLKQLVNAFKKTEYSSALTLGLKRYEETGSTISFDILLDKEYYERLCEAYHKLPNKERKHALYYVSMEIDSFVILMLLRGKALNYDAQWLRVATPKCVFNISEETLESMITAADFESTLTLAMKTYYRGFLIKAQTAQETIAMAQLTFAKSLVEHAAESRVLETFNVGAPLSYLTQKEAEAHNLTDIALGIEAAMKPEVIKNALIFPS